MGYSPWVRKESDTTERLYENHLIAPLVAEAHTHCNLLNK